MCSLKLIISRIKYLHTYVKERISLTYVGCMQEKYLKTLKIITNNDFPLGSQRTLRIGQRKKLVLLRLVWHWANCYLSNMMKIRNLLILGAKISPENSIRGSQSFLTLLTAVRNLGAPPTGSTSLLSTLYTSLKWISVILSCLASGITPLLFELWLVTILVSDWNKLTLSSNCQISSFKRKCLKISMLG